jgi:hypothetical protein
VRPLIVVVVDEVIELGLLLQEVVAGRLGGLQLQGQMHALMAAVLLRVAGLDALDLDAEAERHENSGGSETGDRAIVRWCILLPEEFQFNSAWRPSS